MSDPFEVESLHGTIVIAFGINRWVLVSIGGDEGQSQVDSREELAAYLRNRGLSDREANELSEEAWKRRPRTAAERTATSGEGLVAATGLSSGAALVAVLVIVAAFVLIAVYVLVER